MSNSRLFAVFARWKTPTRSQLDLAKAAGVPQSSISRAFAGDIRPEPETFAKILGAVATADAELARDLLEAYLLDDVPEGNAPDGTSWASHVRLAVDGFATTARVTEDEGRGDELDLALAYISRIARESKHGRQFVLGFYRIRHKGSGGYQGQSQS